MKKHLFLLLLSFSLFATDYDVIIVGGGVAGISAARELKNQGKEVIILEARPAPGGRIQTIPIGPNQTPVDLGPSWVHGIKSNPLYAVVEKAVPNAAERPVFNYDLINRFDTSGDGPIGPIDNDQMDKLDDEMLKEIADLQAEPNEPGSLTLALTPWIQKLPSLQDRIWMDYLVTSEIEHDYGSDAKNLSLKQFDEDSMFHGPDVLMVCGYKKLVDYLIPGLDIRCNEPVEHISYNNDMATVTTAKGNYTADYVLCTVPLGVLKKRMIVFDPPLSESDPQKQQAIDRLAMGILDKTILVFPKIFWSKTQHLIGRIPRISEKGQWVESVNLYPFTKEPILMAFNAGDPFLANSAAESLVETKTDDEVIEEVMSVLRSIYGNDIPNPIDFKITRWGNDPYCLGSYSHVPPGAFESDYDLVAESVMSLYFAGEATSSDYPGTVHGAYISGRVAAKAIIEDDN